MKKTIFLIVGGVLLMTTSAWGQTLPSQRSNRQRQFIKNPFLSKLPKESPAPVVTPPAPATPVDFQRATPQAVSRTADQLTAPVQLPNFKISGIIWNSDNPQAIIDDIVVKVGDVIKGTEITAIHKSGIDVTIQGQNFTIKPKFNK